jgi:ferredoxin
MKGVIFYYSGSGNTKLACQYVAAKLAVPFDLVDVVRHPDADLEPYGAVGLATFTDFGAPPQLFLTFLQSLPPQRDKLAFVLNTYGALSIKTLRVLAQDATARGFRVIAGHSLQTPENYPPMIARGSGAEDAPDEAQLVAFDAFIAELNGLLLKAEKGEAADAWRPRIGLLNSLVPAFGRTHARRDMGPKQVDEGLCIECGFCAKQCPYGAIQLQPKPVFDESACYGCWRCYNRCPEHAIYTRKFRGGPYYGQPNEQLRAKLEV